MDLSQQAISQKMETPVLYFYSDTPIRVNVDVGFPGGIISESYPKAVSNFPEATIDAKIKNGLSHYEVDVLTHSDESPLFVDKENIYSHARNVKSNLIKSGSEVEKFIFYRGIGDFKTDLTVTSIGDNLTLKNNGEKIKSIFLINFDKNGQNIKQVKGLGSNEVNVISETEILKFRNSSLKFKDFIQQSRSLLTKSLIENGLYADEAKAMLDTWENSYLKNKGLRILYVLNRNEVEKILPMKITPMPKKLIRAFIGRIEVLTQNEENKLFQDVLLKKDKFDLSKLGRMSHPIAKRLLEIAFNKNIKSSDLEIFKRLVLSAEQM